MGADSTSMPNAALMRTRDVHVLAILGHRSASYVDSLRLQDLCDLIVGERLARVFVLDQLFHFSLQQHERRPGALRPIHSF